MYGRPLTDKDRQKLDAVKREESRAASGEKRGKKAERKRKRAAMSAAASHKDAVAKTASTRTALLAIDEYARREEMLIQAGIPGLINVQMLAEILGCDYKSAAWRMAKFIPGAYRLCNLWVVPRYNFAVYMCESERSYAEHMADEQTS